MPAPLPFPPHPVGTLYGAHLGWLKGWLRARLGNMGDVADLAHDTFVRLLVDRNAEAIREPRSYLATIAGRVVVDHYRRRALEQAYLETLAQWPQAQELSCEARAIVLETLHEIDALLDGLGAKVKQVFILSQFEGLSYACIAQELGISLRSVNNYMAKAVLQVCLLHAALEA